MTSSAEPRGRRDWWTRPAVVLPIVASIVLVVALLTPQSTSGRLGDDRLSSHLTGSLGARALSELAKRLGWRVETRDSVPAPAGRAGTTIHAVLAPAVPLSPQEAHRYLEAVRGGDALLLAIDGRSALADSLGVWHSPDGGIMRTEPRETVGCGAGGYLIPPLWPDGRVHLYWLRWIRGAPAKRTVFASLMPSSARDEAVREVATGFGLGRGRVVVVADPDLLRNDVLRQCEWGADVIAVRMLEWLRAGGAAPRTTLAFDEYHQGFGPRPSLLAVEARFLTGHPVGRTLLQGAIAALVLLLALAPRALPPSDVGRVERRDPLEQIDALAYAYEQVNATRTATARLVRGVRRRRERFGLMWRSRTDDAFLDEVAERAPGLSGDVALVRRALREIVTEHELAEVGAAIQRIEDTLTTTTT
jgi:hypothetical protein